jgi:primosomal protein N' (replication factor Y)
MIARVRLDLAVSKEFDYLIPPELAGQVEVGSRVKVPFGAREVMAVVIDLVATSPHAKLRPILKVAGQQTLITPKVMELARWIAEYYCCPLELALKSVLPEAVRKEQEGWRQQLFVRKLPWAGEPPKLTKRQRQVWSVVEEWGAMPLQELLRVANTTTETARRLEERGLVAIGPHVLERDPYAQEHILPTQPLALNAEQAQALAQITAAIDATAVPGAAPATGYPSHVGPKVPGASAVPPIAESTGQSDAKCSRPATNPRQSSAALHSMSGPHSSTPTLNSGLRGQSSTFLLHGVTGSGKTEIYLQAIAHALRGGRGAIVLVPEISLTPQTVERFKARFCSGPQPTTVAVLHSHLSAGERHDEWHKIRQGRARIVIGARSAIFAPVDSLGLIVVDEEHEHSYKQEEAPRYHARDMAVVRGQREGAAVVLGSATPSLESYYNVQKGKYRLLELLSRVDDKKMPLVRVVDMRQEARQEKGIPVLSQPLKEAITRRLEKKEQVILFLNRRGYSTSLQCPKCGYVAGCPNCSVSLTYHRQIQQLCCHICGHAAPAPSACPQSNCRNPAIRYAGLGTEKVEDILAKIYAQAKIQRMDSDTLKRKDDYRRILSDFRAGKIDILVGTQMIAKGLHFPNVTLVGIIYADLSLHLPDFRAGERTFQLLTQVAGRSGRGDVEGEVVVQAFTPFHPAIQYARRHDFAGFYEQEIEFRQQLKYPPVSRIALLTLKGRNEDKVRFAADHLKRELDKALADLRDLILAGPAPAPLLRAETFYRYQIMLRTRQMTRLSKQLAALLERLAWPEDVALTVDIDPVNLI